MKILFIGVFDEEGKSTNNSQATAFEKLNYKVLRYNYRIRAFSIGRQQRDLEIISLCKERKPDFILFSKCNDISLEVFSECSKYTTTVLWFMDALCNLTGEILEIAKRVKLVCFDKENVGELLLRANKNSHLVTEGYDEDAIFLVDNVDKLYDVSFLGSIYGDREKILRSIKAPLKVSSNSFGEAHSEIVQRSKINLNMCTADGASDRVYKILAEEGFLLTNDWIGRESIFEDGVDLVIFTSIEDLNTKIEYYLQNDDRRSIIANHGYETNKKFSRVNWAKNILNIVNSCEEN